MAATIALPRVPRNLKPQLPIGSKQQVIREKVAGVGLSSGRVLFTLGENAPKNPETVTIRPRVPAPKQRGSVPGYGAGGSLTVDPGADPNDPNIQQKIASGEVYLDPTTNTVRSRTATIAPPGSTQPTATQQAISGAQIRQLGAGQGQIDAQRGDVTATNAYLAEQQRASMAAAADLAKVQAAQGDVAGMTAAARAQNERNNEAYKFTIAGLAQPTEITTPTGAQPANLPPGVRARIQTPEEVAARQVKNAADTRQVGLDQARIAEGLASSNARAAGIDVNQAQLDEAKASQAPAGQVYDTYSGTFMTPAQQSVEQAKRGVVKDPTDPTGATWVTRAELASRTDKDGNVLRTSDQVWIDPNTGNEFRNGVWTDPKTGNVYDAQAHSWKSPTGETWIEDPRNPGSGYWMSADGYALGAYGVWTNRVTGDAYVIQGGQRVQVQGAGGSDYHFTVDPATGELVPGVVDPATGKIVPASTSAGGGTGAPAQGVTSSTLTPAAAQSLIKNTPALSPIASIFPPQEQLHAVQIALAESGGDPTRVGLAREVGLFQIHPVNWIYLSKVLGTPVNAQTLQDPDLNARAAYVLWKQAGGWSQDWTTARKMGIK